MCLKIVEEDNVDESLENKTRVGSEESKPDESSHSEQEETTVLNERAVYEEAGVNGDEGHPVTNNVAQATISSIVEDMCE